MDRERIGTDHWRTPRLTRRSLLRRAAGGWA